MNNSNDNKRYLDVFLKILVSVLIFIAMVIIIATVGNKGLDVIPEHEISIMIGLVIIWIGGIAILAMIGNRKPKRSNYNKLADGRTMIDAKIVDIEKNDYDEIPSRTIIAEGLDPQTGEKTLYKSKPIVNFIMGIAELKGRSIPVFVSNKNSKNYIVDTSDLEIEAWEKQHVIKEKMEEAELKEVDKVERPDDEGPKNPTYDKKVKRTRIMVGIVVVIMALALIVNAMDLFANAWIADRMIKDTGGRRISNERTTTATIKSVTEEYNEVEFAYEHKVMVEYVVDGKKYEEELPAYSDEYKNGLEIEILYDAEDPTIIMPTWSKVFNAVITIPIISGIFLAGIAIIFLVIGLKHMLKE